jgi:ABC-2 type transport system permease protein
MAGGRPVSLLALTLRQARYNNKAFWRNPAAAFFTFVFPLMFLVIFNLVFGDDEVEVEGGFVDMSTFYVPAILALSVINACFTAISQAVTFNRDQGVLKRLRGTPMPALAFFAGRVLQTVFVTSLLVVIVVAAGALAFGVEIQTDKLPAMTVALVVGAAAFCALGLAMSGFIPNPDAAPAVVNAVILPLLFISDVFIPMQDAPQWLRDFASLFPVSHLSRAMHEAFNPLTGGSGFEVKSLLVMAVWGVIGLVVAVRYFSWEPRR